MWSLFLELLGPMFGAFALGSVVAWVVVRLLLRPLEPTPSPAAPRSADPGGR